LKHRGAENTEEEERSDAMVVLVQKPMIGEDKEISCRDFSSSFYSVTSVPPCFKVFPDLLKVKPKERWDFEDLSAPYEPVRLKLANFANFANFFFELW
jgi:hypothetical protein